MAGTFLRRARAAGLGLLAALALMGADRQAVAAPALWRVEGPHATIYLFGTVHALKQNLAWETPVIARALAASRTLWLEIPHPRDTQEAQRLAQSLGVDPQHPLSTVLPPPLLAELDQAARRAGLPQGEKALEPMRPWLAAVALEDALLIHAGYNPASGVEATLLRQAKAAGKPVRGFESMAQQLHFFADLPSALQRQMLENMLNEFDRGTDELDGLVAAWMSGDEPAIAHAMIDEVRGPFPALYRVLFVKRNEAWAQSIAHMAQGTGTTFIAVGAGHLAGPDGVPALLKRRGFTAERVKTAE
jgi:uncharacterized protein YbaP (TraB family)